MAWQWFEIEQYEVYSVAQKYSGIFRYPCVYPSLLAGQATGDAVVLSGQRHHHSCQRDPLTPAGLRTITRRFRQAALPDSVDLLRNEKPVFFLWNETSKGAFLATGQEPIGEGELP